MGSRSAPQLEGMAGGIDEQRVPGPVGNCSPQQSHGLYKISR